MGEQMQLGAGQDNEDRDGELMLMEEEEEFKEPFDHHHEG